MVFSLISMINFSELFPYKTFWYKLLLRNGDANFTLVYAFSVNYLYTDILNRRGLPFYCPRSTDQRRNKVCRSYMPSWSPLLRFKKLQNSLGIRDSEQYMRDKCGIVNNRYEHNEINICENIKIQNNITADRRRLMVTTVRYVFIAIILTGW